MDDCNEAIRLDPQCVCAYDIRAYTFNKTENYDKALADYSLAIKFDPTGPYAYDGRAWVWATCRDGTKAVESATKACELTSWQNEYCLDTLAAAHAEKGDFVLAVKWQTKALKMKPDEEEFRKGGNERLELYQSGKPYRDESKGKLTNGGPPVAGE